MNEYHIPALLNESIVGLNIKSEGTYVDATFGGGGHSKEILKRLNSGTLIAFDQDSDTFTNKIEQDNFFFIHSNYRYIRNFLQFHDIQQIDGIIADLGISFHQVDEKDRGFSFMSDADLDMRMNRNAEKTASDILNNYSTEELTNVFELYGELRNAGDIAHAIVKERNKNYLKNIEQLLNIIRRFTNKNAENKFFAKVFQAIRIELNEEMESLKDLLRASVDLLKPGGRLVILSYHSLEDRLVKNFIRSGNFSGHVETDVYGRFEKPFKAINKKVICPNTEEIRKNKRARSAKLRIAEKVT